MNIKSLYIEGTRKCQSNCRHCLRGQAQKLDLSHDMVDRFFNNPIEKINRLTFGGGEPTLNPQIIDYIVKQIVSKRIQVNGFLMRTNGRSLDQGLLDPFKTLFEVYKASPEKITGYAHIELSVDQFHQKLTLDKIEELKQIYGHLFNPAYHVNLNESMLVPTGNALRHGLVRNPNQLVTPPVFHRDGNDLEVIYLSANGSAYPDNSLSYDQMDNEFYNSGIPISPDLFNQILNFP